MTKHELEIFSFPKKTLRILNISVKKNLFHGKLKIGLRTP